MNLMDTLMDEFHDEQKFKELNEREVAAWLEVSPTSVHVFSSFSFLTLSRPGGGGEGGFEHGQLF